MFSGSRGDTSRWDYVGHAAIVWAVLGLVLQKPCIEVASGTMPHYPWLPVVFLLVMPLPALFISLVATMRGIFMGGGCVMPGEGLSAGIIACWVALSWMLTISLSQGNVW